MLVRDRERNIRELRRRKQRVHMVLAVVFPEFERVFKNPFGKTSLAILEQAPLPADVVRMDGSWPKVVGKLTPAKKSKIDGLVNAAKNSVGIHESRARYMTGVLKQALKELNAILGEIADQDGDIEELLNSSPWKKLLEIQGVQALSAAKIVSEISERPRFMTPAQMTGFAGDRKSVV